ncbi:hypothetical protein DMC30DRAFT_30660 [Rhodotorula diobovata]|uniref:Uncharacterized protein n=1 Tax=Rhodotorula diobovata TaxID=5288 RepID=A0A5C5FSC1_9BASI|nr:hypothetical protein DMC30DRAFT_30660 [Rhodotorula diobovata]
MSSQAGRRGGIEGVSDPCSSTAHQGLVRSCFDTPNRRGAVRPPWFDQQSNRGRPGLLDGPHPPPRPPLGRPLVDPSSTSARTGHRTGPLRPLVTRGTSTSPLPALLDQGIESGLFEHCSDHPLPPLVDYCSIRPPSTSRQATAASSTLRLALRPSSPPRLASSPCSHSAYPGAAKRMLPSSRERATHRAVISCRVCARRERAEGDVERVEGASRADVGRGGVDDGNTVARED